MGEKIDNLKDTIMSNPEIMIFIISLIVGLILLSNSNNDIVLITIGGVLFSVGVVESISRLYGGWGSNLEKDIKKYGLKRLYLGKHELIIRKSIENTNLHLIIIGHTLTDFFNTFERELIEMIKKNNDKENFQVEIFISSDKNSNFLKNLSNQFIKDDEMFYIKKIKETITYLNSRIINPQNQDKVILYKNRSVSYGFIIIIDWKKVLWVPYLNTVPGRDNLLLIFKNRKKEKLFENLEKMVIYLRKENNQVEKISWNSINSILNKN